MNDVCSTCFSNTNDVLDQENQFLPTNLGYVLKLYVQIISNDGDRERNRQNYLYTRSFELYFPRILEKLSYLPFSSNNHGILTKIVDRGCYSVKEEYERRL